MPVARMDSSSLQAPDWARTVFPLLQKLPKQLRTKSLIGRGFPPFRYQHVPVDLGRATLRAYSERAQPNGTRYLSSQHIHRGDLMPSIPLGAKGTFTLILIPEHLANPFHHVTL